ncbi:MAG TPA: hypothetical protein PK280_17875 [Planctomycetota bacterium]|nr:hypothetical protein [Planctomycetota bacterium]
MNKGMVFWAVWTVIVGGSLAAYFLLIHPKVVENEQKVLHRDLLAARLTSVSEPINGVSQPSTTIRKWAEKLATKNEGKLTDEEKKLGEALPESLLSRDVDKAIYKLYPLTGNLKDIPNKNAVKACEIVAKDIDEERAEFLKSFKAMQFAVDVARGKGNKDFDPPPPVDHLEFLQWVVGAQGKAGQDQKSDQMLEAALGKGCMDFRQSVIDRSSTCTWLEDGRWSGYAEDKKEVTDLILKRLLLRRLIFQAVCRAKADVSTLVNDSFEDGRLQSKSEMRERRVQGIDSLAFIDTAGTKAQPKGLPYRPNGFVIKVKCHAAVVPDLIAKIERIGEAENRPFACWVERLVVERPLGKPDWRTDVPLLKPSDLPRDGGHRYHEWPVVAEMMVIVPEFDEKLDRVE